MTNTVNPFGDFEDDFKKAAKAENSTPGRVPPGTYKFVCASQELPADSGTMVDHEVIIGKNTGTKGFKLFCEILDPESVPNPKTGEPHITKGAIVDHVFWITQKNLPFVKRDASTIAGRDIEALSELTSMVWAGRTFEGVVKDEEYQGRVSSKIAFINSWNPPSQEGPNPDGVAKPSKDSAAKPADPKGAAKPADPKGAAKPADPKKSTQPAGKGKMDF